MASTSASAGAGRGPAPGAVALPSAGEVAARSASAHLARDRPTVALLTATARLLRDMVSRAPGPDEEASDGDPVGLFTTHRGKFLHLPSKVLEAATYVKTAGADATPADALREGVTASCLSSACLQLLDDLEDVLLTSKLHEAFVAAVKIQDYRSRLYVMRLLLDRVPADRLHAARVLVEVLAKHGTRLLLEQTERTSERTSERSSRRGPSDANDSNENDTPDASPLDAILRTLAPKFLRRKRGKGPRSPSDDDESRKKTHPEKSGLSPNASAANAGANGDAARAFQVLKILVRERTYLLFKGAAQHATHAAGARASREREKGKKKSGGGAPSSRRSDDGYAEREDRRRRLAESVKTDEADRETSADANEGGSLGWASYADAHEASSRSRSRVASPKYAQLSAPGAIPICGAGAGPARRRMETELARSLEEAVARARKARDRELRLTYVRPTDAFARREALRERREENRTRNEREALKAESGEKRNPALVGEARVDDAGAREPPREPKPPTADDPSVLTPKKTYVGLLERKGAAREAAIGRGRRRSKDPSDSDPEWTGDDDSDADSDSGSEEASFAGADPTNPLRRVEGGRRTSAKRGGPGILLPPSLEDLVGSPAGKAPPAEVRARAYEKEAAYAERAAGKKARATLASSPMKTKPILASRFEQPPGEESSRGSRDAEDEGHAEGEGHAEDEGPSSAAASARAALAFGALAPPRPGTAGTGGAGPPDRSDRFARYSRGTDRVANARSRAGAQNHDRRALVASSDAAAEEGGEETATAAAAEGRAVAEADAETFAPPSASAPAAPGRRKRATSLAELKARVRLAEPRDSPGAAELRTIGARLRRGPGGGDDRDRGAGYAEPSSAVLAPDGSSDRSDPIPVAAPVARRAYAALRGSARDGDGASKEDPAEEDARPSPRAAAENYYLVERPAVPTPDLDAAERAASEKAAARAARAAIVHARRAEAASERAATRAPPGAETRAGAPTLRNSAEVPPKKRGGPNRPAREEEEEEAASAEEEEDPSVPRGGILAGVSGRPTPGHRAAYAADELWVVREAIPSATARDAREIADDARFADEGHREEARAAVDAEEEEDDEFTFDRAAAAGEDPARGGPDAFAGEDPPSNGGGRSGLEPPFAPAEATATDDRELRPGSPPPGSPPPGSPPPGSPPPGSHYSGTEGERARGDANPAPPRIVAGRTVSLPAGFRRAEPGERGAIRAADAVAAGTSVATTALPGFSEGGGGVEGTTLDPAANPTSGFESGRESAAAEGSARLRRVAARIRGEAPARPSRAELDARYKGPRAARVAAPGKRAAIGAKKKGGEAKEAARDVGEGSSGFSGSEASAAAAAAAAAARARTLGPPKTNAAGAAGGGSRPKAGANTGAANRVARLAGMSPGPAPPGERGASGDAGVPRRREEASGSSSSASALAAPGPSPESDGAGLEAAGEDEMVSTYSVNALEQILREVAMRGGLDDLLEGGEGDEGGDVDVSAEDVAKIVELVKARRKERAESAKIKRDQGLAGKLAAKLVGDGADEDADEATPEADDPEASSAEKARRKEARAKFAKEKVENIQNQLEAASPSGSPRASEGEKRTAPFGAPPPPPPPPPPGGKLPGVPPPPPPPPPGGKLPGAPPPPPPPPPPGGKLPGVPPPPPPPPPPGGKLPGVPPPPPPPPPGGKLPGAPPPPPPPPPPGGKLPGAPPPPPPPPGGKIPGAPPPPPPPPPGAKRLPGAPPPPPPPPPGGKGGPRVGIASVAAAAKVAKVVRKVKMLHWDKLQPHTLRGTVWEGANADDVGLNLADLDSLFALEDASRKKKDQAASGSKRPKAVSLIDPKRSLNISIQLAGLRMPFKRIKEALLKMDDETLAVDQLTILALAVPTQEELGLLRAYQGDRAELATVEQYFLQVMPIPRLAERIAALVFKGTATSTLERVAREYELTIRASSELVECKHFVTVLEGILAVGNHLNGGTYRGQARGFRLEMLLRLTDVKAVDRKTSLLHFVAKELKKSAPGVEFLATELASVKAAAALSLDGTKEALQAVAGGLKSVNDEVLRASGADPSADARTNEEQTHDRFRDVMVPFAESADGAVSSAKALEAEATERMKKATEFYGEPFKADNAGRIFKLVADFLLAFDKVQEDMRKEAELAEKKKKREEAAKIRKSASVAELGADDPGGDEPGEDGVPRRKKRRAPPKQPRRQLDIRDEMHDELKAKAPRMDEEESPASKLARMQKLGFTSTAQLLEHDAETKRKAERAGGVRDADEDKGAKKQKPPPGTSGARGAESSDARQVRHTSNAGSPSTPPAPPPPSASPPRDAFGAGSATLTVRVAARGAAPDAPAASTPPSTPPRGSPTASSSPRRSPSGRSLEAPGKMQSRAFPKSPGSRSPRSSGGSRSPFADDVNIFNELAESGFKVDLAAAEVARNLPPGVPMPPPPPPPGLLTVGVPKRAPATKAKAKAKETESEKTQQPPEGAPRGGPPPPRRRRLPAYCAWACRRWRRT